MAKTYPKSAYGSGPSVPWVENNENGWGPYAWPQGVPSRLLGTVYSADGTAFVVRKELVELISVLFELSEDVFDYAMSRDGGGWSGGYANRAIGSTQTPSSHSRARAIDVRAWDNPQSAAFKSTWPPDLLRAWEQCGFYWGGWYVGALPDTMHLSYIRTPSDVAADVIRARRLLDEWRNKIGGGKSPSKPPTPTPKPETGGLIRAAKITQAGLSVGRLQVALQIAGFDPGVIDGVIGANTTAAVDRAQKALRVEHDRYVGPATWSALSKRAQSSYPLRGGQIYGLVYQPGNRSDGTPWAKLTRSGDRRYDGDDIRRDVTRIQQLLHFDYGAPGGSWIDGVYEKPTAEYVKIAQRRAKIAVDGMVGPATWKALLS